MTCGAWLISTGDCVGGEVATCWPSALRVWKVVVSDHSEYAPLVQRICTSTEYILKGVNPLRKKAEPVILLPFVVQESPTNFCLRRNVKEALSATCDHVMRAVVSVIALVNIGVPAKLQLPACGGMIGRGVGGGVGA